MDPEVPFDVLVRDGLVFGAGGPSPLDVAVTGGTVAALLHRGSSAEARVIIDAADQFVLPGLVDSHTLFRAASGSGEVWRTGSRAAVAGGVTTVIEAPDPDATVASSGAGPASESLVDYLSLPVVAAERAGALERLTQLAAEGATTVVIPYSGADGALLEHAARLGVRLVVHPLDRRVLDLVGTWLGPPAGLDDHELRCHRAAGIVATAQLVELARRHGAAVHVQRVSSREEVDLLAAAAASGLPVTFEVTCHHLAFTAADFLRFGARVLPYPPARQIADQDRLWAAVLAGEAHTVVSDHSAVRLEEKLRGPLARQAGLAGAQELLPTLLTGLRRRAAFDAVDATRVASRLLAEQPARIFGLGHKGRLVPGGDADLVLLDPDRSWFLDPNEIQSWCGWSAYEGWSFLGRVELTMRRGEVVFDRRSGRPRFGDGGGHALTTVGAAAVDTPTGAVSHPMLN